MTGAQNTLPDALVAALDDVLVSDGGREVTFGDEEPMEAPSPAALRSAFAAKLYELLHTGPRADAEEGVPRSWRDGPLEQRLEEAMPHTAIVRQARLALLPSGSGSHLVALVDGVRFSVGRDLLVDELPAEVRDGAVTEWTGRLRLPAARPGLSPGFFLADGSAPRDHRETVLRVYLHVTADAHAPGVWGPVLSFLEREEASYRAKIGSNAGLYPRRDAMVVYLSRSSWHLLDALTALAGTLDGLGDETSLLTRRLAPGVGIAFEPQDRRLGWTNLSFGEHRCHAIADGILARATTGSVRGSDAAESVVEALRAAEVDVHDLWRATDSPDLATIRAQRAPEAAAV